VENAATMGQRLLTGLQKTAAEHTAVGDVRGLGLMLGNEFVTPDGAPDPDTAARVQREAGERGLMLLMCGAYNNVVRMIPALVVNSEQVDEALEIWSGAVGAAV
jgi:4-aminobutyrate aminotransferase